MAVAIIVASGRGTRFGGSVPKQYILWKRKSLVWHSVRLFSEHPDISHIQLVIHPEDKEYYTNLTQEFTLLPFVYGGKERKDSVYEGMKAIASLHPETVLIHDAVRPFCSVLLVDAILTATKQHEAVIPALPVVDTVKYVENNVVIRTLDRDKIYRVQTPQGFDFKVLYHAFCKNASSAIFTDEAALLEAMHVKVHIIPGEERNRKITYQKDIRRYTMSHDMETRVGMGYDVHRLVPNKDNILLPIALGGIGIPHSSSILAHSDGDVLIHAIVDALLGAMALGDIGEHFPPSDDQWKDAASCKFLTYTLQLLQEKKGRIIHVDSTLICEAPKVNPYKQRIRESLAAILELPLHRVSLKATTTEKLGFLGRKEGIAAEAVITIKLPNEDE